MDDIKIVLNKIVSKLDGLEEETNKQDILNRQLKGEIRQQKEEIEELRKVTISLYEQQLKVKNPQLYEDIKGESAEGGEQAEV